MCVIARVCPVLDDVDTIDAIAVVAVVFADVIVVTVCCKRFTALR